MDTVFQCNANNECTLTIGTVSREVIVDYYSMEIDE